MAIKELRICDICERHPARQYETGTWREFDGHMNEEFTHYADLCDGCRAIIDSFAKEIKDKVGIHEAVRIGKIKELSIKMARRVVNMEEDR
jgi:hypothetical protein